MTKPLKIVLLGDPGTGKTNLLSRLLKNQFDPKYKPTTGMNEVTHDIHVEADIWDFAGREKYRHLADPLLCDADGVLLVYDVSTPATFENLTVWLRHIRQAACPKTVIKLVGNKNDLQCRVPRKKVEQFAADNGLSYVETSALNDMNVHLAFESIAQEIDVAKHSVSEPPFSFVQKQDETPFQVVLIDIEQAAFNKKIVCVKTPLDQADFIAISYRWGEVREQVIDTKLGYIASVTSFALDDFYNLCDTISHEPDLKSIKYVWVDAICVDQNNHARRKATIYQMSNIYHRAAYILAVPDLHLQYLKDNQIFDPELRVPAFIYKEFIYYLLQEKMDQVVQITEQWFDEMNIPKSARKEITSHPQHERFTDHLDVYNEQDPDSSPCLSPCEHNCYHPQGGYGAYTGDCHDTPNGMFALIQYAIHKCHHHSENKDCALCSLQMEMCQHQRKKIKHELLPGSDQQWLACVLKEIRYDKYKGLVADRAKAIAKIIKYLEYLIKDWSSRVWVISEYNIAKAKKSRKLKFWFLSLDIYWNDVEKLGFFVFDFDKKDTNVLFPGDHSSLNHVIARANANYLRFQETLRSQLNERSFVEMMLDSMASRNEDRFYAILPSSEYKTMLTSREVVSSWQIDTIVAVKLKLFELMTTKHKLELLYRIAYSLLKSDCTFPAFANINMDRWTVPPMKERNEENHPCNFDLSSNATLRLVPPMENGFHFHKLNLSPKMYYVIRPNENSDAWFVDENQKFWEALEINDAEDDLVHVKIPMYMYCTDTSEYPTDIVLFGNFKKNKWLLCQTFKANQAIKDLPLKGYDNRVDSISFDIY